MRKIILRIFTALSITISLFFIVFLLMTVFGKVQVEEFDNSIVKTLCLALGGIFVALSVVNLVLMYSDNDALKEILLHYQKGGTAKASVSVVKKIIKTNIKLIDGVKYRRCKIVAGDFGVRLKLWIAIREKDMKETEELLRAMLEDVFMGTLGFKFYAIDIHLKKITAKYQPDMEIIKERAAAAKTESETVPSIEETDENIVSDEVAPAVDIQEETAPQEKQETVLDATNEPTSEETTEVKEEGALESEPSEEENAQKE